MMRTLGDFIAGESHGENIILPNGNVLWIDLEENSIYLDGTLTVEELRIFADYLEKKIKEKNKSCF